MFIEMNCLVCKSTKLNIFESLDDKFIFICSSCGSQFHYDYTLPGLEPFYLSATEDIYKTYERIKIVKKTEKQKILVNSFILRHKNHHPMAIDIFKRLVLESKNIYT